MSSGADLARQALNAAKAAARQQPGRQKPRRAVAAVKRGTGCDPVGLGGILEAISAANGWDVQQRAGSIIDRWAELAPTDLVDLVRPEHYDADRRCLHLRPVTQTAASMLRLMGGQLAAQLNRGLGSDVVAAIKVLPVRSGVNPVYPLPGSAEFSAENRPGPAPAGPGTINPVYSRPGGAADCRAITGGPAGAPPSDEMRAWRDTYRRQRAQAAAQPPQPASRWFDGAYGHLREPEEQHRNAVTAQEDAGTAATRARRSADAYAAALAVARTQRRPGDPTTLRPAAGAA